MTTTKSSKAKARRLQQHIAKRLQEKYGLSDQDVRSTPMGVSGSDIQLSSKASEYIPYTIEAKHREGFPDWPWELLNQHSDRTVGVIKKNYKRPLAVLDLELLLELIS